MSTKEEIQKIIMKLDTVEIKDLKFMSSAVLDNTVHAVNEVEGVEYLLCTGKPIARSLLWQVQRYTASEYIRNTWACKRCKNKLNQKKESDLG